jgi:hypothetical protein
VRTPHLHLVFSIRPMTVAKEKLDTHALMHLYAERIEDLRAQILALLEQPDQAQSSRLEIYLFRELQDHLTIGPEVTTVGGKGVGSKRLGTSTVYSMFHDPRAMPDDESLWRNVVHHTTHLVVANLKREVWLGNQKCGWIDEGIAHWFEDKLTGRCMNFCYEEVGMIPGMTFKGGKWRAPVRKMVDTGKARSFAELSQLNSDQLTFEDHALSFAYVDHFLAAHGGKKFGELLKTLKNGKVLRDALQAVYGTNPLTVETQFQQWVKDNYAPEPR